MEWAVCGSSSQSPTPEVTSDIEIGALIVYAISMECLRVLIYTYMQIGYIHSNVTMRVVLLIICNLYTEYVDEQSHFTYWWEVSAVYDARLSLVY